MERDVSREARVTKAARQPRQLLRDTPGDSPPGIIGNPGHVSTQIQLSHAVLEFLKSLFHFSHCFLS